jgi:CHAT domain-containing protein
VAFEPDGSFLLRDRDERGEVYGRGRWRLQGETLHAQTEKSLYQAQLQGQQLVGQRNFKDGSSPAERWSLTLDQPAELPARQDSLRSVRILGRAQRLPFTALEAEKITPVLQRYAGMPPRVVTQEQALPAEVLQVQSPRVVVLSTHGFFLDEKAARQEENPLLRCGLLLAGCNNAEQAKPGQNTGVLSGLQVAGCDLRGCELVVLSACETGLGDVRHGEGVAGLRQAFQLAGAQSVAASLWQVDDAATAQLMIRFWEELAKGQSKAEALRSAQLALIQSRRERNNAAHPFFWAAFTLTGSGR